MQDPFCEKCGMLLPAVRKTESKSVRCPYCGYENSLPDESFYQSKKVITHTPKDKTRIMENEPPPIPRVLTDVNKKRCKHPRAIFKGFYQFSRGDEASRKYWWCPDCNQVFRFSGKTIIKERKKIHQKTKGHSH